MSYQDLLKKYLHEAKVYELLEKYQKKSYKVIKDYSQGGFQFDLFVTHEAEKNIYIEVKSGILSKQQQKKVIQMAEFVNSIPNSRFDLIMANPPKSKTIEIYGIEEKLYHYLSNDTPSELLELAYRGVFVNSVEDVDIDEIYLDQVNFRIKGTAMIEVTFDLTEGDEFYESFPFEFSAMLDDSLDLVKLESIMIDTSSFYE